MAPVTEPPQRFPHAARRKSGILAASVHRLRQCPSPIHHDGSNTNASCHVLGVSSVECQAAMAWHDRSQLLCHFLLRPLLASAEIAQLLQCLSTHKLFRLDRQRVVVPVLIDWTFAMYCRLVLDLHSSLRQIALDVAVSLTFLQCLAACGRTYTRRCRRMCLLQVPQTLCIF
jgi:hypothetical protein